MSLLDAIEQSINNNMKPEAPKVEPKVEAKPEPKSEPKKEVIRETKPVEIEEIEDTESEEEIEEKALSFKDTVKEVKKEIKEQPRIEKIIEDGVEREISIDELKKGYQKASVSGKRFDEAAKAIREAKAIEQQVQDFVELLDNNPIVGLYEVLGEEKTHQVLEQYRREMMEYEQMSPEAKENFLLKRRLQARDTTTRFKAEKEYEVLSDNEAQANKEDLFPKVEKVSQEYGLDTNEMKLRLLNKMRAFAQYKGPNQRLEMAELEILAEQVREEFGVEVSNRFKSLKGERLIKELGNDVVDEVRKELLNQYKMQRGQKIETPESKREVKRPKQSESIEDVRNFWKDPTSF
jgi:hypothetical protein